MDMLEAARRIELAAQADSPVLVWGEDGTGKKLIAETIHRRSRRADAPMVMFAAEQCKGQSPEDELFGIAEQPGALAVAAGGTLLIDEITALPTTGQARLLDAAEGRYLSELQDSAGQPIDFRLMATTRYEIAASVNRGALREDLYYRLAVVTIRIPPLRERKDDIPSLVEQMLGELCAAGDKPVPAVDPELMQYLIERPWHGNGRELRDCLDAMLAEGAPGVLKLNHLPPPLTHHVGNSDHAGRQQHVDTLAEMERAAVMQALKVHQGNRT
jgi:DNA-binding NtrC family response regulator